MKEEFSETTRWASNQAAILFDKMKDIMLKSQDREDIPDVFYTILTQAIYNIMKLAAEHTNSEDKTKKFKQLIGIFCKVLTLNADEEE